MWSICTHPYTAHTSVQLTTNRPDVQERNRKTRHVVAWIKMHTVLPSLAHSFRTLTKLPVLFLMAVLQHMVHLSTAGVFFFEVNFFATLDQRLRLVQKAHAKTLFEIAMALFTISVSFPSKLRFSATFSILLRFGESWNPTNCEKFNADGSWWEGRILINLCGKNKVRNCDLLQSGWYRRRRLREPISPLSLLDCDQL